MIWYLLNIFIISLAWFWPIDSQDSNFIKKIRTKRTCIVGTINWIVLSGCRDLSIGTDTLTYKISFFDQISKISWETIKENFVTYYTTDLGNKDPGYLVVEKLFSYISTNYHLYLIFIAVLFFIPMGVLIYKYSQHALISYILFSTLFYSFFAITGHRQTIATAIAVWGGSELIRKKKLLFFIIVVLLASTIHLSAICFLLFYFVSKIKITKMTMIGYWILIICAYIFRNQFLHLLQFFIGYENYQYYEGASGGMFMFLLLGVAVFITIFSNFIINVEDYDYSQSVSINALFMACIFCPLLLINPSCMRVVQYFSVFLLFLLPDLGNAFKPGESKRLFYIIISFIMIILLIFNHPSYTFFFL